MTFTQAISSVLSHYATFSGRARRSEYWWFYLFTILVSFATSIIDAVLNTTFSNDIGIIGAITSLALLLPTLAVTARRLHDTGRTGWWMLIPLLPLLATIVVALAAGFRTDTDDTPAGAVIGLLVACTLLTLAAFITLLVFLCLDTKPGTNKYGPSPKEQPVPPAGSGGYYPPVGPQPPAPPAPGSNPPQT